MIRQDRAAGQLGDDRRVDEMCIRDSYISDRIAVIHKGDIVELADAEELVTHAIHPYTRSLLSAIPKMCIRDRARAPLRSPMTQTMPAWWYTPAAPPAPPRGSC